MNNFKKILLMFFLLTSFCFATILDECYKIYPKDADTLFMSAISAIASNSKFEISEIQTKNGYILFSYGAKYYLLTLTKRYKNQTEIKVLPQNSEYNQGSMVTQTIFSLIDNELKKPMEQIK